MSVASFKGGRHWNSTFDRLVLQEGKRVRGQVPTDDFKQDGEYQFYIAMSVLENFPDTSGASRMKTLKDEITVAKIKEDESKAIMAALLRDVYSVQTQFVFTQDKPCSDFGLWAHRSILSKYPVFEQHFKQSEEDQSNSHDDGVVIRPLTLTVDKVSFATFCALLMYIYTGAIKTIIDPSQFAIGKVSIVLPSPLSDSPGTSDRQQGTPCWHPLVPNSPWDLKPVQWSDLLFAADLYKIDDLRSQCQKHLIDTLDDSKVVDTLIHVGPRFPEVKEAAVNYIAKNMKVMYAGGNDPFAPFVQHPSVMSILSM
ncbi:hypothetical protein CPC16_011742 [Podila verticillata]|nr:hypothetical protein CPC16_011742 [Podila verticillata]